MDDPHLYGIYAPDTAKKSLPPEEDARLAVSAHNLLGINAGWISAHAAGWLKKYAGGLPFGYQEVGQKPVTRLLDTPVGAVGMVFFPEGPLAGKAPTAEQEQMVIKAGRSLTDQAVLVIGISPWGSAGEKAFLPKAQGVFSCLLGSGEGISFPFHFLNEAPGVLWIRPDSKGRAVNILELYALPVQGQTLDWRKGENFNASLVYLDQSYPPDPAMQNIIGRQTKNQAYVDPGQQ